MTDRTPQTEAAVIVARHVADERPGLGVHRGPLPDESLTYPCVECGCDWPCDVVLLGRWIATLPSMAEYNAVSEDREMWRRLTGEAQQEAAEARAAGPREASDTALREAAKAVLAWNHRRQPFAGFEVFAALRRALATEGEPQAAPDLVAAWAAFHEWEQRAADGGGGMTRDQWVGASLFLNFLENRVRPTPEPTARHRGCLP